MSGTMGAGNPLLSSGGVDSSIPLRAGAGAATNPFAQVGQFAQTLGAINTVNRGNLELAQMHNQAAAAGMAPFLALPPDQQTRANLTDMAARLEASGVATGGWLHLVQGIGDPDGAAFGQAIAPHILARAQAPENAVKAIAPTQSLINVGGQLVPSNTPQPFMRGAGNPQQVGPGLTLGYSPGERLGMVHRPATDEDVARDPTLTKGQDILAPATTVPATGGYNPGVGGARIPSPGSYVQPQKPLGQLGAPYRPPGAPSPAAPGAATPAAAAPGTPGSGWVVMKAPDGTFHGVPEAKVPLFRQHGYQ